MTAEPGGWGEAFLAVRRVSVFLLGALVILDGIVDNGISEVIVGAVMVGVLPIEDMVEAMRPRHLRRPRRRPPEDEA